MSRIVVFQDVRVFDGRRRTEADSVLVTDGVITAVGTGLAAPADAEVVDGRGATLLPGLIDAHYHLMGDEPLRQALTFGTTTVLSMGDDPAAVARLKRSAAGGAAHADIRSAGVSAKAPGARTTVTAGTAVPSVGGPDDAAAFVAARVADGSDFLKIRYEDGELLSTVAGRALPVVSRETMAELTVEAHADGLLVLVHIGTLRAAHEALDAGVDGLAHTFVDVAPDTAIAGKAAACGAFVVPTLSAFELIAGQAEWRRGLTADPDVEPYLRAEDLAIARFTGEEGHLPVDGSAAAASVRAFRDAGVPVLAGSDPTTFLHGIGLWRELELLVAAGLSPVEALSAATAVPARLFGLHDRGRIAPGHRADLLLVDGDPTTDVRDLRHLREIRRGGVRAERVRPVRETPEPKAPKPSAKPRVRPVNSGFLAQTGQGRQGDFALVAVEAGAVVAYRRDNDEFGFPWRRLGAVPAPGAGAVVSVTGERWRVATRTDDGKVRLLDGDGSTWSAPVVLDAGAVGDLALVGNNLFVPTGTAVRHYRFGTEWQAVAESPGNAVAVAAARRGDGWELAVRDGAGKLLVLADTETVLGPCEGTPSVVFDATGRGHLLVPSGPSITHYTRTDDGGWERAGELPEPPAPPVAASVIAGAFGNLELVARLAAPDGALLQPYYHDRTSGSWAALPLLADGQKVFGNLGIWEAVVRRG